VRDDAGWEAQLAKLNDYAREHGDCNVPRDWAEDPELGSWVSTQRRCKKLLDRGEPSEGMTAARAAKLEALGFWKGRCKGRWDTAGWEAQLAKLKAYQRKHGDCNVPQGWVEDPPLGRWVSTQRKGQKKLDRGEPSDGMTAARAVKLEALGFAWELSAVALSKQKSKASRNDVGWEAQLAKLKAYKKKHGDCSVPYRWDEDPMLGRWVGTQRTNKRILDRGEPSERMTAARVAKLDALGFVWVLSAAAVSKQCIEGSGSRDDAGWEAQLAKLKAYKRKHGDCNVSKGSVEDSKLGSWVSNQRRCKKVMDRGAPSEGMTAARAVKLEALGFAWALSQR
jgi:hypothetical protein